MVEGLVHVDRGEGAAHLDDTDVDAELAPDRGGALVDRAELEHGGDAQRGTERREQPPALLAVLLHRAPPSYRREHLRRAERKQGAPPLARAPATHLQPRS